MKLLLRILLGIAAVAVLVIGAAVVFTFTGTFKRLAREQIERFASKSMRADVSIGRIEGSIWGGATADDVRLEFEGKTLVAVPRLVLGYDLLTLLSGTLRVGEVRLVDPTIHLRRDAEGRWNLLRAVASAAPQPEPAEQQGGGLPIGIDVSSIEISGGTIEIATAGEPPRVYRVNDLSIDAGARIEGSDVGASLRHLKASVTTRSAPPLRVDVSGVTYGSDAGLQVDRALLATPDSKLTLQANVLDLGTLRTRADLHIDIAANELRSFLPSLPLEADLRGKATVEGVRSDLGAHLTLHAAGAALQARARADLSGGAARYGAELHLNDADIGRLLTTDRVGGEIGADLRLHGTGTQLGTISADGSIRARELRIGTAALGDATTDVALHDGTARSEGRLAGAQGKVAWNGELAIAERRYEAEIRTEQFNLAGVAPDAARLDGEVGLTAHVRGHGFEPAAMNTAVDIDLRPSRIGPVEVSGGSLDAEIADARLHLRELTLEASGATLSASGGIGVAPGAKGELEYALRVPDAEPWLGLVQQTGGGSLQLTGTASGSLGELSTSGSLQMNDLHTAALRVGSGSAKFAVAGIGDGWPHGDVRVSLQGVDAGERIESLAVTASLEDSEPPLAHVEAEATMWQSHTERLRADLELAPQRTVARLEELRIDVPVGVWQLARPARVVRENEHIAVDDLRLANGDQILSVDGALGGEPGSKLDVVARDFQLAAVEPFIGSMARDLQGSLDADVSVAGTLSDPRPTGTIALRGGQVHVVPLDVTIRDLTMEADLTADRIAVTRLAARARDGTLEGKGSIDLQNGSPSTVTLDLEAERWPAIHNGRYKAEVSADLHAGGPLTAPTASGRVEIVEADLRPDFALLQQNEPPPRDRTILVVGSEEPAAKSDEPQDGTPAGDLVKNVALDLTIVIRRNTWIKRDQSALELNGEVHVRKTADDPDPALTGSVRVERGWIYLYGRRFEAERGVITFTGGREIDPALDIVLRSRVGQYDIRTIAGGTAQKPTLQFESTPHLEEADVLAVLMFGKPVSQLGQGEQVALRDQAANIVGGYVANRIGRSVGDALGLQISEIDVAERRLGVGTYITPNTYVSVNQQIGGEAGREVKIEYYFTPRWTAQTETDSDGESGIDVFWRREY